MTKFEAYIMRFVAFYRKAKEYFDRVIAFWLSIVICIGLGIIALYYEYVLHIYFWGIELSIFFIVLGILGLILKLTGNLK